MTYEEAQRFIKRLEGGNEDDSYRPNTNLSIVLRLALYSGLKPIYTYRLTMADLTETANGGANGYYLTKRCGKIPHPFSINPEDFEIIKKHCKRNHIDKEAPIITCSERACRMVFANVATVYYSKNTKPKLKEIYAASPKRKNKTYKKNEQ